MNYNFTFWNSQVQAAVAGVRKLCNKLLAESKELLEVDSDQHICLQVSLCKLPKNKDKRSPMTIKMYVFCCIFHMVVSFLPMGIGKRKMCISLSLVADIFLIIQRRNVWILTNIDFRPLPHPILGDDTDVLLITRMLDSERGSDYEKTLNHFKELLIQKKAAHYITEVCFWKYILYNDILKYSSYIWYMQWYNVIKYALQATLYLFYFSYLF